MIYLLCTDGYKHPLRMSLCVKPSPGPKGESQFEAFQSILALILHAQHVPEIADPANMTPYEWLCHGQGVTLFASQAKPAKKKGPFIFYKPSTVTHYKAADRYGVVKDPYAFYQAAGMDVIWVHIGS